MLERLRTEAVIEEHWKIMSKYDPQHRTKLVIDEWGVWYRTFQNPNEVRPASLPVKLSGETLTVEIHKQAVAAIEIQLA